MKHKTIRLSSAEKIEFFSNMHTVLRAGIPILKGVESLLEDTKGNLKTVLSELRSDLIAGRRVYTTLAKFSSSFDKVTVNLTKASEEAGTLETTLCDIKENMRSEMEFSDKVRSALIYPLFVLLVFLGVMIMMFFVVVPKISQVFSKLSVNMPITTKLMIIMSDFAVKYYVYIIIVSALGLFAVYLIITRKRKWIVYIMSRLPLISGLYKKIDVVRFSRSMSLLLASGIPIVTALELSSEVVNRRDMNKLIKDSVAVVLSGGELGTGLAKHKGIMPNIVVKLIELGEKSGGLEKSMTDVSEYMEYEVSKSLKSITAMIEPIMLVFVGLLVGGMMMSIIAPIYNLISQVGNR